MSIAAPTSGRPDEYRPPRTTFSYTSAVAEAPSQPRDEAPGRPGDEGSGRPRDEEGAEFQRHRARLLKVAYGLLGSFADAEDVVQEAWLRWSAADRSAIAVPHRFLMTVVTRLSIDRMRLAYRQRETYVGQWLPEPVLIQEGQPLGPADTAAQRETLSLAMLRVLQRLSAPERAVFVLREAFDLPYAEIGEILGLSGAHARQLHRRGAAHLAGDRARFTVDPGVHRDLVERFVLAARTGERETLDGLLARDVTLWSDGGGKARAALRPVSGAERVSRFVIGIIAKQSSVDLRIAELNGQPGLLIRLGAQWQACSFEVANGLITGVQLMANPDKLGRLIPAR
ncbi:RNA polymerase sigma-70 factor [Rugosimonospora acidiphila]|uniref:RNA polymerase sigma-70 factor n=1 Tax=Rugosimonospora acidiphila TaxID=556531 RepID=A0ABP9SQP0_9ACTN